MTAQGAAGPMARGLNQIIKKYTSGVRVFRVAAFAGIFGQHTTWKLQTVVVNPDRC